MGNRNHRGWKQGSNFRHSNIGELYSRRERKRSPWDIEDRPHYLPSQYQLDNPPPHVRSKMEMFRHTSLYFWCDRHGQYLTHIPLRTRGDEVLVDLSESRCPGCIADGTNYLGLKVESDEERQGADCAVTD